VTNEYEEEKTWKEAVVAFLGTISAFVCKGLRKTTKNLLGQQVSGTRFEPGTYRRSVNHSAATFRFTLIGIHFNIILRSPPPPKQVKLSLMLNYYGVEV
jgi:hypothetical protein